MIWHIFKKDARLLWPIAALVVVLQVCAIIPAHLIDHGIVTPQLTMLRDLLPALALLGIMVIVVLAIHQDPIPGARQDWLIRPIRRRDLAVAKLLFVLLMVQVPLWVVDVGGGLADGFALPAAAAAAAARNAQILCMMALPAMMLGAVTRTFVEALIVAIAAWIAFAGIAEIVITELLGVDQTIGDTGSGWMFIAALDVVSLVVACAILAVQYSGRRTVLARGLAGVAGALLVCVVFLPWSMASSMQAALSSQPSAARGITVVFDPQAGRYRVPAGAAASDASTLHLPLQVGGMPGNSIVVTDWAYIRIEGLDGTTLYHEQIHRQFDGRMMIDGRFEVRSGRNDGAIHSVEQTLLLPPQVYARLAKRQVRMAVDYSLTLLGPAGTYSLPTTSARTLLPGLGRCRTGIDPEGDDVSIDCLSTARRPSCLTAYLEYPATGLRNPEYHSCDRDYAPRLIAKYWPDAIYRLGGEVAFYDFSGLVRYPVDGAKVAAARLIIKTYAVLDHFSRHVDTPIITLAGLAGLAAPPPQ